MDRKNPSLSASRIATNETITFINANKKRQAQSIDEVSHILNAQRADHFFTGEEIEIKLHQAISTLPEKQKLVFNMKYFDDMKYQDIASVIGGSIGSLNDISLTCVHSKFSDINFVRKDIAVVLCKLFNVLFHLNANECVLFIHQKLCKPVRDFRLTLRKLKQ